ncbi:2-dehydro-3-deoxyphosphogluconate aldolase [Candidatus Saccharibacteria bacterium SW_7_54_9]|nr:MAG: 2-dehydro-3-deoxyphosphogluconate aldolase [Candidatus Saccharibacteria bacterium SW_7_54_9]
MDDPPSKTSRVRSHRLERLTENGAVAVLRTDTLTVLPPVANALLNGGITAIEVTMTTPDALSSIEAVREAVGEDSIVGVGSVTDPKTTQDAIQAGAEFVVSPIFKSSIIDAAHALDVPAIPGGFTPTEVQRAHEAEADLVKVFPASTGGPSHVRALKAPLPHLDLMPTGGISIEDAGEWLRAGAELVGMGSALLDGLTLRRDDYSQITRNARRLRERLDAVQEETVE